MSSEVVARLRAVNQRLRSQLASLAGKRTPGAIAPGVFPDLLQTVGNANACRREFSSNPATDPEWENEISEFRHHLELLATILPSLSGRLLAEKARLEVAKAHVAKAAAWAEARAKTL